MSTTAVKAANRVGQKSMVFPGQPSIWSTFSVVGPMEGTGPLGKGFDTVMPDDRYGEKNWEQTESKMLKEAITHSIQKAGLQPSDVDVLLSGDLLDQLVATSFAAKDIAIPTLGLFSACATFASGMALGASLIEGGFGEHVAVAVSSHHHTAERQFRFPTELGVQKPRTSHWTATIAAATIIGRYGGSGMPADARVRLTGATLGEVMEVGAKDPLDMGTAMAPAAVDTLAYHFKDLGVTPETYDLIITGDLGEFGLEIATDMLETKGFALRGKLGDCGLLLYDRQSQGVHAGASGTACSAGVFCAYIEKGMKAGRWQRVLFAPTGALFSPMSFKQGQPIPAVCHAIALEVV